jgi:DNA polymerase (family 10)
MVKTNSTVVTILHRIADFLELDGTNSYKVAAYRKAARAIDQLSQPVENFRNHLESIDGVGKAIAQVVKEIIVEGKSTYLEELIGNIPPTLPSLLRVPGLGPKTIRTLADQLGIASIQDLIEAVHQHKIRDLPGLGAKTEEKIREGLEKMLTKPNRILLGVALPVAEKLVQLLSHHPDVADAQIVGSIRRMRETVSDIDLVLSTENPKLVVEFIEGLPFVKSFSCSSDGHHVMFVIDYGGEIRVDVYLANPSRFPMVVFYYTGSPETVRYMLSLADQQDHELARVLSHLPNNNEMIRTVHFPNETSLFEKVGLPYVPPELREDEQDIRQIISDQAIPKLVQLEQIRGDLHAHTVWSDGDQTIEQMAEEARGKGYEYLAITDHSRSLVIARGLSVEKLQKQHEQIHEINKQWDDFQVMTGIEMDILNDGVLDYPDEIIKEMDIVIGSIHSGFRQTEKQLTTRLVKAIENQHVDVIAHPTGRLLNRRDPYSISIHKVLEAAKKTDTAVEINANPNRLDLKAEYARKAVEDYGVRLAINTDAHDIHELEFMRYGVATARRGRVQQKNVINTMTSRQLHSWLKRNDLR